MTGESMAPTLGAGDGFLARPLSGLPRRGELVVMRFEDGDSLFHVLRRAVALAGDTVSMRDGRLWVNGRAPDWPARVVVPGAARTLDGLIRGTIYTWGPVIVGPDSVFVLSDTRDMIGWPDSRFLGAVPAERLEDRMMFVLWRRGWRKNRYRSQRSSSPTAVRTEKAPPLSITWSWRSSVEMP